MTRLLAGILLLLIALPLNGWAKPAPKSAAKASTDATQSFYRRAFDELDRGHADIAVTYAEHGGHDPALNKVLEAEYMARPGNDVPFEDMKAFIDTNPDWPNLRGICAIAEQKLPAAYSNDQILAWFEAHPPVTTSGFYRYMSALEAAGQSQTIGTRVITRWVDGDFGANDLGEFHARYARFLTEDADRARLDRLLWKNDAANARRMFTYVDENARALANARLALASQSGNAAAIISRVPRSEQNDPGLQYDLLRYRVRNNMDESAVEILTHAPDNLGKPEAWWEQRQTIIYRLILKHDYSLAYELAADHGQTAAKKITEGEFLAGFLALRLLNDPERAKQHFQSVYDNASTPVSRARGAYWLGRTYEALNDKTDAEQAYETASALSVTYYGQLATARLFANPTISSMPEPKIPANVHQEFFARDAIRAIQRLHDIGEYDRSETFFRAAVTHTDQRAEFVMLAEMAGYIKRPDLAITAAKAANQKNLLMASSGFPILNHTLSDNPEPAFVHALIRQESMFNPNAKSSAGAHGLMQLMPATAREVARKIGIKLRPSMMDNVGINLRLGTTFIQNQLAIFDGSYVLALAGYNAGPRRVRDWMEQIGDPRDPRIDPVDWVEMIPFGETRNYVQRILENTQVYRARLGGGQAPLMIIKDLRR